MLFRYIGLVLLVIPIVAGCGRPSNALPAHPLSAGLQLREKLNAMPVAERLAYIKKHPETVEAVAGGRPPLPRANMTGAKSPVKSAKPAGR